MRLNKERVKRWLEGQRAAQAFVEAERRERLRRTTPEERLRTFHALCSFWQRKAPQEQRAIDRIKIKALLRVRRALDRLEKSVHDG
ncbi:MAG: hypothetical protein R6V58_12090 [Planctomycetota bacterium]